MKAYTPSELLTKQLSALPDGPGCYIFKDEAGEILYIGKALSLKLRVKSYWVDTSWRERPKLAVMMPKVVSFETILTNSEKEALLLEANLIRQKKPRYNVSLKDDRRYPWLAITYDVAFPRLIMVRDPVRFKKDNPRSRVFGPYVEAGMMWETMRILRKVFPMRQRKTPLFKDRPCMNYHIGLCLAPCQNKVKEDYYNHMVKQVELFLAGSQLEVIDQLNKEMEEASENLEFEQAAKIRDRLYALKTVIEKQQVFFQSQKVSQDIVAQAHTERLMAVCLMKVREGKLISAETITVPLTDRTQWDEAYEAFVDQYYTACEDVMLPHEILLQSDVSDMNALSEFVNSKASYAIKILVPQRGGKTDLVEMAQKNAEQALTRELTEQTSVDVKTEQVLTSLKEGLGLTRLPNRIECFDISNISGTDNVASMVVFEGGRSKKSDYRTFKIKSVEGEPNDFASMKEVIGRRYSRLLAEGKPFPDLIIIDGGKGQLGAALEALAELASGDNASQSSDNALSGSDITSGITPNDAGVLDRVPDSILSGSDITSSESAENEIPPRANPIVDKSFDIIGLAKRQEEVYFPGKSNPVLLPRRSDGLHLLQQVRDEAHRFAITYHRKLRAKRVITSQLDAVSGLGAKRRKKLIDHFGSFDEIKKATLEEIEACGGIPKKLAQELFDYLIGLSNK